MKLVFELFGHVKAGRATACQMLNEHLKVRLLTTQALCVCITLRRVQDKGKILVIDEEKGGKHDPVTFVQNLIDLKSKYDRILREAFSKDKDFETAINSVSVVRIPLGFVLMNVLCFAFFFAWLGQAFSYFVNLNEQSPEYISLFIDNRLKKGAKEVSPICIVASSLCI